LVKRDLALSENSIRAVKRKRADACTCRDTHRSLTRRGSDKASQIGRGIVDWTRRRVFGQRLKAWGNHGGLLIFHLFAT